jgi:site-specific DNA-methyltransferase (adenine-specific)
VARADKVWKEAAPETKEKIKAGEVSFNQAYQEIRKKEKNAQRRKEFVEKKEAFEREPSRPATFARCHNKDCREVIAGLGDGTVDLLLSDPPYGMDFKSGKNDYWNRIEGDTRDATVDLLDEVFSTVQPKLKPDAHIYVFGNPNEVGSVKPIFEKYFTLKNILVWDREIHGMGDLRTYSRCYDVIFFGYNGTWKDLNGTRDPDILRFPRVAPGELVHPTEKPAGLLQYIVKKSSVEGDLVFDPFAGSCSTLTAAYELGRNSEGCELETQYIPSWLLK